MGQVNLYFERKIFLPPCDLRNQDYLVQNLQLVFNVNKERAVKINSMIHRTEKAHSSFIGKKFTVGKHHVVVEVKFMIF